MAEAHSSEAAVGVYGKHPGFGDFIAAGWPEPVQAALESWLRAVLTALRDMDPDNWHSRFDAAPEVRFWFGADALGAGPLVGVMRASRDKVGRRFPLLTGIAGADIAPPVIDGAQVLHDTLGAALDSYARQPGTGAAEMAAHVAGALPHHEPAPAALPGFWAARADGDVVELWADVARTDHQRLAAGRSYLWARGAGGAALYATTGLPGPDVLGWLIGGAVAAQAVTSEEPHIDPAPAEPETLP